MATVTLTVPAACAGTVAVSWASETTVRLVAAVVPNLTAVAPVKFVPVIVTVWPPVVDPAFGLTPETAAAEFTTCTVVVAELGA